MSSKLPWDIVKAESLRSICTDLGRRLSTRAEMIDFLATVEDKGLDAALAVSTPTPKRKAERPKKGATDTSGDPECDQRPKRARRSIGDPITPVKSRRGKRAEERSSNQFVGVVLSSRRKSGRHQPEETTQDNEESSDVLKNPNEDV